MRLSLSEIDIIKKTILNLDADAQIYLYGSRLDKNLRGGDIDLFVISEKLEFKDKLSILVDIKMVLGDQKIDLSIKSEAQINQDPFFQQILATALILS